MTLRTLLATFVAALCMATVSEAATAFRIGTVTQVQLDSHIRSGYQDVVWLSLSPFGAFTGANCGADWVWFNAKEDAHLLAQVLSARATNSQLRVYVDDSLPKIGPACHVMTILTEGP